MSTKTNIFFTATAVGLLSIIVWGCGKTPSTPPPSSTATVQPAAGTHAASTPRQPTEVVDLDVLLNRIPNEFSKAEEGGWDKFTMPKVKKWVRTPNKTDSRLVGATFRSRPGGETHGLAGRSPLPQVVLLGVLSENLYGKRGRVSVAALCDVAQDATNPKSDEWIVRIKVGSTHGNYAGMGNRILPVCKNVDDEALVGSALGTWGAARFTFKCTESEARKWDALGSGKFVSVTIEGDVAEIEFEQRLTGIFNNIFVGYMKIVESLSSILRVNTWEGHMLLFLRT